MTVAGFVETYIILLSVYALGFIIGYGFGSHD